MSRKPIASGRYRITEVIKDAASVFVDLKRNPSPSDHEIHETIHSMQWSSYLGEGLSSNRDYNKPRLIRAVRLRIAKLMSKNHCKK